MSINEDATDYAEALARNAGSGISADTEYQYPPIKWGDMHNELNHHKARAAVLEAQWHNIPWHDIEAVTAIALFAESTYALRVQQWLDTHMPEVQP